MIEYDFMILLSASPLDPNGRFLEVEENGRYLGGQLRMESALVAYATQKIQTVIVVGGGIENTEPGEKGREVRDMKKFLVENGIPSDRVIAITSQSSTLGNLRALYKVCKDQLEGKSVGLLTSFYHMPRTMRMVQDPQFDWNVRFIPHTAESYMPTNQAYQKRYSEGLLLRILEENDGLGQWEEGNYHNQHLEKEHWLGEVID